MKILVVEDNANMRTLLRLVLERSCYVPLFARDGKEGLEKAITDKPKLILMDIRMPIMDGWETMSALRAHPETKEIPILVITALLLSHELKACLEAGCNGYIVKPFSILELESKIGELLAGTKELRA